MENQPGQYVMEKVERKKNEKEKIIYIEGAAKTTYKAHSAVQHINYDVCCTV